VFEAKTLQRDRVVTNAMIGVAKRIASGAGCEGIREGGFLHNESQLHKELA
jgi:hypothetical protein